MPEYHWVSRDIATVSNFLSPDECAAYIDLGESIGFEQATIDTIYGPRIDDYVRNNARVILDDSDRAAGLWGRIWDYIPTRAGDWAACGVNERFRIYRYHPGQRFDWHRDGSFQRDENERSLVTFMIYLNDDFTGGATRFEDARIVPQQGTALFFTHKIRHTGEFVSDGCKYVLRTDVMYLRWRQ